MIELKVRESIMSEPVNCRCGGEAVVEKHQLYEEQIEDMFIVRCIKCDIQTSPEYKKEKAIEAWNRVMGTTEKSSTVERTAKVMPDDVIITVNGYRYHYEEYLCGNCKKKVIGGDEYCSHCGCRLDWGEDIPMEYFENGGI